MIHLSSYLRYFAADRGNNGKWISEFAEQLNELRQVDHPVLLKIIDGGFDHGLFYLVLNYHKSVSLRRILKKQKKCFSSRQAVEIISSVASGVSALHKAGICHGHIDPKGIVFVDDKVRLGGYMPKVLDQIYRSQRSSGAYVVESAYLAPEQAQDEDSNVCGDVYSLSAVFYEILAGRRLFSSRSPLETAMLRNSKEPPSAARNNPDVPPILDAVVQKGLSRDPQKRFADVGAFMSAVSVWGADQRHLNSRSSAEGGIEAAGQANGSAPILSSEIVEILKERESGRFAPLDDENADADFPALQSTYRIVLPSFIVLSGESRGRRYWIEDLPLRVGSDQSCEICIGDERVPKEHSKLEFNAGCYYIEALSDKGFLLNEELLLPGKSAILEQGNIIQVGPYKLRFVVPKRNKIQDQLPEPDQAQLKFDSESKQAFNILLGLVLLAALLIALILIMR